MNVNNENEKERERFAADLDVDPGLKDGIVVASGLGGADNVELKDAAGSADGPQSLPSLKSSGLLDWSSSRTNCRGLPAHGNTPLSHPHSNPPIYPQPAYDTDGRSTPLVSNMPVGLPWLANESR